MGQSTWGVLSESSLALLRWTNAKVSSVPFPGKSNGLRKKMLRKV